ncbi:hypothetical protein PG997_000258 [Apiospora hydei]|uniref:Uncharacterized protein n=1 Tax=Apiospora hydei TaxID=1337664 RepID=A0ABR1XAE6_9PEZI
MEEPHRAGRSAQFISSDWRRRGAYALAICWIVGSAIGMIFAFRASDSHQDDYYKAVATCSTDGSFIPFHTSKGPWKTSQFFAINIVAARSLSFSVAKFIDVVWDVIGGRGFAVAMAVLSFKVFRQYLTVSMRRHPVTYQVFRAIYLESEPSIVSTYRLVKDGITGKRRVVPATGLVFMVATLVFVLIFPTLSGSMTGYINVSRGFVQASGGDMVPFESLDFVAYVIHDGWRVNLTGDYIISLGVEGGHEYTQKIGDSSSWILPLVGGAKLDVIFSSGILLTGWTPQDVWQYGFYGLHNNTSVWPTDHGNVTLAAPSLNISAFYLDDVSGSIGDGYGHEWVDPRTGQKPFSDEGRVGWTAANQTFTMEDIVTNSTCQPVQNVSTCSVRFLQQYQWGFSLIQLLIAAILLGVWIIGLCVMSYTSNRHNPLEGGQPEVLQGWRALLTLAEAMNLELASSGIEPHVLKDDELQKQIDRHIGGGRVYSKSGGDNIMERRGFPCAEEAE